MVESIPLPGELTNLIYALGYILAIGAALSLLYGISEWFSRDRVLKLFEGKRAFVILGSEAYYGRIVVPSRSGGGFEIYFPPENIENPLSLIAFLVENYREAGERKFLEEAERLLRDFKAKGLVPGEIELDNIRANPWSSPSLVSRKVYSNELGNLHAIIMFRDFLEENERRKRWRELRAIYHPSMSRVIARKVYNALAFVKDKLASTLTRTTSAIAAPLVPEIREGIVALEKKAISGVGATYDPLLENSIGRLVTVELVDIDGERKRYQGILREYSNNYILVYDVDYRIQVVTKFKNGREEKGYPKPTLAFHGFSFELSRHLELEKLGERGALLRNVSEAPLKVEVIKHGDGELKIGKVLQPGEAVEISVPFYSELTVEYEVSKEADIMWPRSKVRVVGLGDYPPHLLSEVLVMKVPRL